MNRELSVFLPNFVGFNDALTEFERRFGNLNAKFPPYDIIKNGETNYTIVLAVAGFDENDIEITSENGVLKVEGKTKTENDNLEEYLYKGIAERAFTRAFSLAEHVEVVSAKLEKGLLTINLERKVPEQLKAKKISISK